MDGLKVLAQVENNMVVNTIIADGDYTPEGNWHDCPPGTAPGWQHKDGQFTPPEPQGQPAPKPGGVEVELAELRAIVDDLVMTQLGEKEEPYEP